MIRFYDPKSTYYELSNFYPASFVIDGVEWPTSEHYYQAMKFPNCPEYIQLIRSCDTPNKAFQLAGQRKLSGYKTKWMISKTNRKTINEAIEVFRAIAVLRSDWNLVKEDVMMTALRAKFTQNAKLKHLLLSTGTAELVEASPRDSYWGEGRDGKGQNRLGKLLMELRNELQMQSVNTQNMGMKQ